MFAAGPYIAYVISNVRLDAVGQTGDFDADSTAVVSPAPSEINDATALGGVTITVSLGDVIASNSTEAFTILLDAEIQGSIGSQSS